MTLWLNTERGGCARKTFGVGNYGPRPGPEHPTETDMPPTAHQETAPSGEKAPLLGEEIQFYEQNKEALIRDHLNRHLLIKGTEVIGSYSTEGQAIREGVRRFGTEPFLVRLTGEDTPVVSVPALTLGIPLCR